MSESSDNRWSWAEREWQQAFAVLRDAGYELERVSRDVYWRIHEAELRQHFPPEVFFNIPALCSEAERAGQEKLAQTRNDQPLSDCCVVRSGGALAATFCGTQVDNRTYRMNHSHVHPDFRRRGIYGRILQGTIAYTAALGFDSIVSDHAPGNNPVIIAKLSAGFRIFALEIDPMVGMSVRLKYFHNPDHLAAYEFRCGLATINPRLLRHGSGAIQRLIDQLRQPFDSAD